MLENLRLTATALAQRDVVPALVHLHIRDRRVQAYNGRLAIDAPVELDFNATAHGTKFIAAMNAANGEGNVTIKEGSLTVSRGRFRVRVPCIDGAAYPVCTPVEPRLPVGGHLRDTFRRLRDFISTDASRPWSMGMLITKGMAYATNNVVLCRVPCGLLTDDTELNVPVDIVDAVLARDMEPTHFAVTDGALAFYYEDGVWFRTQLFTAPWPTATVTGLFADAEDGDWRQQPDGLTAAFEMVKQFDDGGVPTLIFRDGHVVDDAGHVVWDGFDDLPNESRFNVNMTLPVLSCTKDVKWNHKPGVHMFRNDDFYAVVAGMRA